MMTRIVKALTLALILMLMISGLALAEPKTVVVGTNPEFAPFEFIGDDGQPTGIDMEIIVKIFEKIDPEIEVKIESMAFDALIPAMISGKIDLAIAGMSVTEERQKSVLFSDYYFEATQAIVVPAEDAIVTTEADLDGKKIGVQLGTTGDLYATDNFPNAEFNRFEKVIDAINDVASGRLDAVVVDKAIAETYLKQVSGLVIIPEDLSEEKYAIPLKLSDTELCDQINQALAELKADGTLQAIIDKYIPQE